MPIVDEFFENYEILLHESYKRHQQYPITVTKKLKRSSSGIYCRNGQALRKLREIEKELTLLNNEILRFWGVDKAILQPKRGRGRPRKQN